jgi:hypothetical protein
MPRRTTIILEDIVYERLIRESIKRYGTARALSKVLNELIKESLGSKDDLIQLIYSEKLVTIKKETFDEFRRELSKRLEER